MHAPVNGIYLGPDGIAIGKQVSYSNGEKHSKFGVHDDGQVFAKGAWIEGSIYADEGNIGGWTIGPNYLQSKYDTSSGSWMGLQAGSVPSLYLYNGDNHQSIEINVQQGMRIGEGFSMDMNGFGRLGNFYTSAPNTSQTKGDIWGDSKWIGDRRYRTYIQSESIYRS